MNIDATQMNDASNLVHLSLHLLEHVLEVVAFAPQPLELLVVAARSPHALHLAAARTIARRARRTLAAAAAGLLGRARTATTRRARLGPADRSRRRRLSRLASPRLVRRQVEVHVASCAAGSVFWRELRAVAAHRTAIVVVVVCRMQ